MDAKSAKRIDGVYRNVKQLPLLGFLGLLIPMIGVFLIPITAVYSSLMSKLLLDFQAGNITIEKHDRVPAKTGELSTEQKLHFLQSGETRLWIPYAVGTIWLLLIIVIIVSVSSR